MKYNGHKDKCQLRRQQLMNKQNKSQFQGKKSLSKRIIAKSVDAITANNINDECESLGCMVKVEELTSTIMYHIRFGRDTRPSIFHDDAIIGVLDRLKDLQVKFDAGVISAQEHIEMLEEIDTQIIEKIDGYKQSK